MRDSSTDSHDDASIAQVEQLDPAIARWVQGTGHVQFGDQDGFGFIARALDYGGLTFEGDKPRPWLAAGSTAACPTAVT